MLSLPPSVRIFVYTQPADMRKSFTGLSALVSEHMQLDPLSGHLFIFTNRRANKLKALYWDHTGYLQADAYSAYDQLFIEGTEAGPLIEVACWMHGRRYFYNARDSAPGLAQTAMAWIGQLYTIEKRAKDLEPHERKALRKQAAKPILRTLGKWLKQQRDRVLPKDPIGKAVHYALSNWRVLNRYVYDGELSIDNGASERDIRPIKLGAHNWLFADSDAGGRTAVIHFSIIRSCERHGIDPFAYYRDVLTRLPDHPISRIDELLPDHWQPQSASTS